MRCGAVPAGNEEVPLGQLARAVLSRSVGRDGWQRKAISWADREWVHTAEHRFATLEKQRMLTGAIKDANSSAHVLEIAKSHPSTTLIYALNASIMMLFSVTDCKYLVKR